MLKHRSQSPTQIALTQSSHGHAQSTKCPNAIINATTRQSPLPASRGRWLHRRPKSLHLLLARVKIAASTKNSELSRYQDIPRPMRHPRARLDLVGCSLGHVWASIGATCLFQCSAHGRRCSSRESLGDNALYTLCIEIPTRPTQRLVSLFVLQPPPALSLFELPTEHWWDQY
jgi:hypothetical protein